MKQRGWKASYQEPYLAIGEFANVVSAFEQVKSNLPDIQQMDKIGLETQKNIRTFNRQYCNEDPYAQGIKGNKVTKYEKIDEN